MCLFNVYAVPQLTIQLGSLYWTLNSSRLSQSTCEQPPWGFAAAQRFQDCFIVPSSSNLCSIAALEQLWDTVTTPVSDILTLHLYCVAALSIPKSSASLCNNMYQNSTPMAFSIDFNVFPVRCTKTARRYRSSGWGGCDWVSRARLCLETCSLMRVAKTSKSNCQDGRVV